MLFKHRFLFWNFIFLESIIRLLFEYSMDNKNFLLTFAWFWGKKILFLMHGVYQNNYKTNE